MKTKKNVMKKLMSAQVLLSVKRTVLTMKAIPLKCKLYLPGLTLSDRIDTQLALVGINSKKASNVLKRAKIDLVRGTVLLKQSEQNIKRYASKAEAEADQSAVVF